MALTNKAIEDLSNRPTPAETILEFFQPRPIDPEKLSIVEGKFLELGHELLVHTPPGPEQTVAMRHLLDAKHAAVRSLIDAE